MLRWPPSPGCCALCTTPPAGSTLEATAGATRLADPAGGTVVCHNDVEPSNVVFRDGIAVALLDFEFAAPGRPVYDLAHLARFWVPIDDDFDQARLGWRPADRPARLRLVADAYGLDSSRPRRAAHRDGRCDRPHRGSRSARSSPPVIRTRPRCGTGPVEASASTAGAAGGPNTTTSSLPPSPDGRSRLSSTCRGARAACAPRASPRCAPIPRPGSSRRSNPCGAAGGSRRTRTCSGPSSHQLRPR